MTIFLVSSCLDYLWLFNRRLSSSYIFGLNCVPFNLKLLFYSYRLDGICTGELVNGNVVELSASEDPPDTILICPTDLFLAW